MSIGQAEVVVANSSTFPELTHLAAGLIRADYQTRYLTSTSWAEDSVIGRISQSRVLRETWIGRQMRRRLLPADVRAAHVVGIARIPEVVFQVISRVAPNRRGRALRRRLEQFESLGRRYLASEKPEVLLAQYNSAERIFSGASASFKVLGYPIAHHRWIARTYEIESTENPNWADFLFAFESIDSRLAVMDREVAMADLILVPSSFVYRTFVESGVPASKLAIVPLGSSVTASDMGFSSADPWPVETELRVLFVGQITQRKGVSYLLDAVDSVPGAELVMIGNPVPGISDQIGDRASLLPSSPREEVAKIMRAADVLVLPSLAEGFPLVAIEAMSVGTPCVLSTSTFAEDVIEDGINGLLIEPRDSGAIAQALTSMLRDPQARRAMGERAMEAASGFTWERYASSVVHELVSRGALRAARTP